MSEKRYSDVEVIAIINRVIDNITFEDGIKGMAIDIVQEIEEYDAHISGLLADWLVNKIEEHNSFLNKRFQQKVDELKDKP